MTHYTVDRDNALFNSGGRWTVLMIAYLKGALERHISDPVEAEEALRAMSDDNDPAVVEVVPPMSDAAMSAFMACYEADDDDGVEALVDREFVKRPTYPNARQIVDQMFWQIVDMSPGMREALKPLRPRYAAPELVALRRGWSRAHPDVPEPLGSALSPPGPGGWR